MKYTNNLNLRNVLLTALTLVVVAMMWPAEAFAALPVISIPGVDPGDDFVTKTVKVIGVILLAVVYVIFAAIFVIAAWTVVSSLMKMSSDRDQAGSLVGRVIGSVVVAVIAFFFLSQAEVGVDLLRNFTL